MILATVNVMKWSAQ